MNNLDNKNIPPLTKEQIWRLYQLSKMPYEEIDLSDIPEITEEEFAQMKANRLRKQNLQNVAS